jgi:heat shock protein HslJ
MKLWSILFVITGMVIFSMNPNASFAQNTDDLANTQWELVSLGGEEILEGSIITLEFSAENSVSGSAGCNGYGSDYSIDGTTITFNAVFSTRRFCDGLMQQESAYIAALESATQYTLTDGQLVITYGEGDELVFQPAATLVSSAWQLVAFDDEPVVEGSIVTLSFGEDQRAFGSGGCNGYGGDYNFNDNAISFGMLVSTMMACLEDGITEQETAFFAALSEATHYEISREALIIFYGDGKRLVFEPAITLTDTTWALSVFDGTDPVADTTITLTFDGEGNAYGSSGCNSYSGSYEVDGETLEFGMMMGTLMACLQEGVMEQEQAYLQALGAVERYLIERNQLTLMTEDGKRLTFIPVVTDEEA